MLKSTALSIALVIGATACLGQASAQECTARSQPPDATWSAAPTAVPEGSRFPLKVMTHLRCLGCRPEVSMELSAGPAQPALASMPVLGKLAGMAWARAVVADPGNREGLRESVLRSELRQSPGCQLQGQVSGAVEVGNMGMVATDIRAECDNGATKLSGIFYSGYDGGTCMYQVQLVWGPGHVPLSPESEAAVRDLLKTVRFGR
jgi:hypothetical protein